MHILGNQLGYFFARHAEGFGADLEQKGDFGFGDAVVAMGDTYQHVEHYKAVTGVDFEYIADGFIEQFDHLATVKHGFEVLLREDGKAGKGIQYGFQFVVTHFFVQARHNDAAGGNKLLAIQVKRIATKHHQGNVQLINGKVKLLIYGWFSFIAQTFEQLRTGKQFNGFDAYRVDGVGEGIAGTAFAEHGQHALIFFKVSLIVKLYPVAVEAAGNFKEARDTGGNIVAGDKAVAVSGKLRQFLPQVNFMLQQGGDIAVGRKYELYQVGNVGIAADDVADFVAHHKAQFAVGKHVHQARIQVNDVGFITFEGGDGKGIQLGRIVDVEVNGFLKLEGFFHFLEHAKEAGSQFG